MFIKPGTFRGNIIENPPIPRDGESLEKIARGREREKREGHSDPIQAPDLTSTVSVKRSYTLTQQPG